MRLKIKIQSKEAYQVCLPLLTNPTAFSCKLGEHAPRVRRLLPNLSRYVGLFYFKVLRRRQSPFKINYDLKKAISTLIADEKVTENHALMMYEPLLERGTEKER